MEKMATTMRTTTSIMTTSKQAPNCARPHCDVCMVHNPRWTFPCVAFHLPAAGDFPEYQDDGRWGACDQCKSLIETNDTFALFIRGQSHWGTGSEMSALWAMKLLTTFVENRTGEAYLDETAGLHE